MMDDIIIGKKRVPMRVSVFAGALAVCGLLLGFLMLGEISGLWKLLEQNLVGEGVGLAVATVLAGLSFALFELRTRMLMTFIALCLAYIVYLGIWG